MNASAETENKRAAPRLRSLKGAHLVLANGISTFRCTVRNISTTGVCVELPSTLAVPNRLTLRIQPDEGLSISFSAKRPGSEIEIDGVAMNFSYRDYFAPLATVCYETLIYDCLIGDATLFQRADTVEAAWRAVQGVLDSWAGDSAREIAQYAAGSAGPAAADALLARDRHAWLPIGADGARRTHGA